MWPFKRRRHLDGSLDLDDLISSQETRPAVCYVNFLILVLAKYMGQEVALHSSQPLPTLLRRTASSWSATEEEPGGTACAQTAQGLGRKIPNSEPHEIPSFAEVANRLKVMCNLDPIHYPQARDGEIRLIVRRDAVVIHVSFDDTAADPGIHLRMERETSHK
jgi:hypothetical protein